MININTDDILEGQYYSFEMSSLALRINEISPEKSSIDRKSRILHEYDHFVRMLGTSYGAVRYGFLTYYLEYFLKSLRVRKDLKTLISDWNKIKSISNPKLVSDRKFKTLYFSGGWR